MEQQTDPPIPTLIVGLGNPGSQYTWTRHNIGFLVIQKLAEKFSWTLKEKKRLIGSLASGKFNESTLYLFLPATYMNASGEAVRKVMDTYKLHPSQVLVVVDDINLEFGAMRLRKEGSAGGHNGLKSLQQHLGTLGYPRLRMGVGSPKGALTSHVLGRFNQEEMEKLDPFLERGVQSILQLCSGEPFERVVNQTNTRPKPKLEDSQAIDKLNND